MDLPAVINADDVLAQPTRARLFALLTELRRPGTAELADRLDLHVDGVRVHLERLERAGLVAVAAARGSASVPGPRRRAAASRRVERQERRSSCHAAVRAAAARGCGVQPDVEAVGRAIGRELAPRDCAPDKNAVVPALSALGFRATVQQRSKGSRTYCLGNCPYRDAVRQNADVVCTLHRGITRGLLKVLDPTLRLAAFEPRDPDAGGCRIDLVGAHAEPE